MVSYTFTKQERLHLDREFRKTLKNGRNYSDEYIKVFVYPAAEGARFSRLGLVVSGKIGSSNERNRVKRRLREIFRLNKHRFLRKADVILMPKKKSVSAGFCRLQESVLNAWGKMALIGK